MKHTIKAMSDLLFEVAETKAKVDQANIDLYAIDKRNEFPPFVAAMAGGIEEALVEQFK